MLLLFLGLAAWGLLSGQNIQAQSTEQNPAECARRILADDAYQKELIKDPPPKGRRAEDSGSADESQPRPALGSSPGSGPAETISQGLGRFVKFLLYVVAALGALLGLFWLVDSVHRRRAARNLPATVRAVKKGTESEAPIAGLSTIEKLAANGHHAAAVHTMLLLAVQHLCRAAGSRPAPSLTSRELIKLLPRTEQEKTLLNRLVTTVEVSLFGGRPVGPDAYNDCLLSFRELSP